MLDEWDRYIVQAFGVPSSCDSYWSGNNAKLEAILFRYPQSASYARFRRVSVLVDFIAISQSYYNYEHRVLAFAILWKCVHAEFVRGNMQFYWKSGIPAVGGLFGGESRGEEEANDWIFEMLAEFSKLYIGKQVEALAEIMEFVEAFLEGTSKARIGNEDRFYASKKESCDRSYEEMLGLQTYPDNYLMINKLRTFYG